MKKIRPVKETAFYAFENDHSLIDCGMCLIIQCPDYSFFVVDSGHYLQPNDNDRLHKFMRERTPEGEKIVINGWFITHAHTDHISKLFDFVKYNCDDVIIEGFYMNLLPDNYVIDDWGREEQVANERLKILLNSLGIPKITLKTWDKVKIRNLNIDVLYTWENAYPRKIEDFNDSSTVIMLEAEGTRIFIPGDASGIASDYLEKNYGKRLKCDIVQISHHGHFGLSENVYRLLNAPTAVFPVTRIKYDEEYLRFSANRVAVEIAKECFITSDGTVKFKLPYTVGEAEKFRDETFEDFKKIKRLWGYEYTAEYKKELFDLFIKNGGVLENYLLPVDYEGTFLD